MRNNEGLRLREAMNVPDALKRDKLVRRIQLIRADAVVGIQSIQHWNRTHPDEVPISTDFEEAIVAWCDGKGPFPEAPRDA